jgi:hypothetical protein
MNNKTKINKRATIQNILKWASRSSGHRINIPGLHKDMKEDDWETTLPEIAKSCGTEIVYRKELSELQPKPGEFYSVRRRENMINRYMVIVKEGDLVFFAESGLATPTSNVFEPRALTYEQAKKLIKSKLRVATKKMGEAKTSTQKEEYEDSIKAMKRFSEEHFRS